MGKFDCRAAAARINQVRWETNYPSREDAYWAYQNAVRGMMRDIANHLKDCIKERFSDNFKQIESNQSYLFVVSDRVVVRCDWVGYGLSDEMFEIFIGDSKDSVDNYCTEYRKNPDVFPSQTAFAYVAYDASPEDVMDFMDITLGDEREIKDRLAEFYKRGNIHSHMKSDDESLLNLWIDVVTGMIRIPA